MNTPDISRPIFFVGMPRSGTTILFEAFARHPDLGWPSNYSGRQPQWPWLNLMRRLLDSRMVHLTGRKKQYAKVRFGNRYLPHPDEAYRFWDHYTGREFSRECLTDTVVDTLTRECMRAAVAAIQWQRVVSAARHESHTLPQDCYHEVKYEEFVTSPHRVLSSLYSFCALNDADAGHGFLDRGGVELKNMNAKFHDEVVQESARRITAALQPMLAELGYA